jgi:hypothetical protein
MPCLVVYHGLSAHFFGSPGSPPPREVTKGRGDAVMIEKSPVHLSANHLQMPGVRGAGETNDAGRGWFVMFHK